MELAQIKALVTEGKYTFCEHTMVHGLEDGFEKVHCIGAMLDGRELERYVDECRVLILGWAHLTTKTLIPLHVVCDYRDPANLRIITAYIPNGPDWESPTRRTKKRHLRRRGLS